MMIPRGALTNARGVNFGGQRTHWILFLLILSLEIFSRVWQFEQLPPGLNPDEASIGVEAYDLYHYGTDRNGIAFPVHFVAWGSGQNALYGYVLIPFIAVLGLSPQIVRLPMLISGILSIPLVYFVATRIFDRRVGLLAMFCMAISPWHILLSRWGLESNFLPFVFLLGFACTLAGLSRRVWFFVACMLFGASLYAYGTAYAVVPVFLLLAFTALARGKHLSWRVLATSLAVFTLIAAPIGLLLAVNTFKLNSVEIGALSVPRLPSQARFLSDTVIYGGDSVKAIPQNLYGAFELLVLQSDGLLYNGVDPYGYFYKVTFPAILIGFVLLAVGWGFGRRLEGNLLAAWIGASFIVPAFQPVNINRFNIVFIPLLICFALFMDWLSTKGRFFLPLAVGLLLAAFAAFTAAYHSQWYRQQASWKFNAGLLSALGFARSVRAGTVCVGDEITMPYIYALFAERASPAEFLRTVQYEDVKAPFRQVRAFGRYVFGMKNCIEAPSPIYVLRTGETPPRLGNRYEYEFFEQYVVYYPKL